MGRARRGAEAVLRRSRKPRLNKRGTIMRDEDKDIPSEFRKQLELIRDDYRGLANEFEDPETFNIDSIRSRINI